jgi:hypothetical protein
MHPTYTAADYQRDSRRLIEVRRLKRDHIYDSDTFHDLKLEEDTLVESIRKHSELRLNGAVSRNSHAEGNGHTLDCTPELPYAPMLITGMDAEELGLCGCTAWRNYKKLGE